MYKLTEYEPSFVFVNSTLSNEFLYSELSAKTASVKINKPKNIFIAFAKTLFTFYYPFKNVLVIINIII